MQIADAQAAFLQRYAVGALRNLVKAARAAVESLESGARLGWHVGDLDEGLGIFIDNAEDRIAEIERALERYEEARRPRIRSLSDLEGGAA